MTENSFLTKDALHLHSVFFMNSAEILVPTFLLSFNRVPEKIQDK